MCRVSKFNIDEALSNVSQMLYLNLYLKEEDGSTVLSSLQYILLFISSRYGVQTTQSRGRFFCT